MRELLVMLVPTVIIGAAAPSSAAIIYDESVAGDLTYASAGGGTPPVLGLALGSNRVNGSIQVSLPTRDWLTEPDAFQVQLPPGAILSSISVSYGFMFGGGGLGLSIAHFLYPAPPSSSGLVQTSVSSVTVPLGGTEPLFAGQLPAVPSGLHEIYLNPSVVSSSGGPSDLRYSYSIDLGASGFRVG